MKEITRCRLDGFAIDLGDMTPGINAVAAPVLDQDNCPIGYITVAGFFQGTCTKDRSTRRRSSENHLKRNG